MTSRFRPRRSAELSIQLQLEALELFVLIKLQNVATYIRLGYYVHAIVYNGQEFQKYLADYSLEGWLNVISQEG